VTFDHINDWFDVFYDEYIENKRVIRGFCFSGAKIEIYTRNNVCIVLTSPYSRGITEENKSIDFVKTCLGINPAYIIAELTYDRFVNLVNGTQPLTDAEWIFPDE
jgi:hypothetical protein